MGLFGAKTPLSTGKMAEKRYESTYIVGANLSEDAAKALVTKFEDIVTKNGGKVIESEGWGIRRLAYPIKKITSGRYVSLHFRGEGGVIAKLERAYQLDEEVLRWLTLEMPDQAHDARIAMKKRVVEVEARRAAMAKAQQEGVSAEV
jgi:small subunit ribosomal protein S6